jgi:hypothetical protein
MRRNYRDEDVGILELVENPAHPMLEGFTFESCTIIGPAVVASMDTEWVNNELTSSMFIVIPEARQRLEGVIGLKKCTLTRCRFMNVGLIGPESFIRRFFD